MPEFPEPPQEIVTVSPAYQGLPPDRKESLLRLLVEWAQFELSLLGGEDEDA